MKKLLYISFLSFLLPVLAWGQTTAVSPQFRRDNTQVDAKDSLIYTFPGISPTTPTSYRTLWNAAKIRNYGGLTYVGLTGNQTISGVKTFANSITALGAINFSGNNAISGPGAFIFTTAQSYQFFKDGLGNVFNIGINSGADYNESLLALRINVAPTNPLDAVRLQDVVTVGKKTITTTVAGLRALTNPQVDVMYRTTDLGQGSWNYYTATGQTDNTGAIVVNTATGGYFKRIFSGRLNVVWFGAVGDNVTNDAPAFKSTITAAKTLKVYAIDIPAPSVKYKLTDSIAITSNDFPNSGLSLYGTGSSGSVQIEYTGTGYCFTFKGAGAEGDQPLTRFEVKNIKLNGGTSNTTSSGGFNVDRCYNVLFENVFCTGWAKSDAVAVRVRNTFNFKWDGGQIANGFPAPAGSYSLLLGSATPNAWNCSNVEFKNLLIQYSGSHGVYVDQQANIFDNLTFNNISFGKNFGWSIYFDSPNINNISVENCHFESPGYNTTSTPNAATGHIYVSKSVGLKISNNSFQDALTYIDLDSEQGFSIDNNKFFETGFYTLTGNTLLKLTTATANAIGGFGQNFVRTDQIDNLYSLTESGGFRVDLSRPFRTKVVESTWNGEIFPNPANYQGSFIDRYQSATAPFDQMISNGTTWYRLMLTSKYKGERTSIPTTTENAGSWYANSAPTVQGQTGSAYIVFGWNTSGGGAWKDMRMPLDQAPFVVNTTTTDLSQATLNSTYPDGGANNNVGKIIYCPNIVAGAKAYIKLTTTFWLTLADLSTAYTNVMTTLGDLTYGGASGAPTRLAGNTATSRQFLTSTGNGTISAAPAYFNLFGTANTWGGVQTFSLPVFSPAYSIGLTGGAEGYIGYNHTTTSSTTTIYSTPSVGNTVFTFPVQSAGHSIDTIALRSDFASAVDNIISKTANYTIVASDFVAGKKRTLDVYVDATAGNVTITMPSASAFVGYTIYVTKTDTSVNSVTVNTVLGGSTILTQYQSRQFNSNSTSWFNH